MYGTEAKRRAEIGLGDLDRLVLEELDMLEKGGKKGPAVSSRTTDEVIDPNRAMDERQVSRDDPDESFIMHIVEWLRGRQDREALLSKIRDLMQAENMDMPASESVEIPSAGSGGSGKEGTA